MNEILPLIPALIVGIALGIIFFIGLWWTVQKGLVAKNPAVWFLSSSLIRTAMAVSGFYVISAGSWQKLVTCLLGFLIARFYVTRSKRFYVAKPTLINRDTYHAP